MLRRLARLVAAAGIVCAMPAHALGLGEVDVRSKLNQKFSASIPVIEATPQDLESLQVTMASAADFERAGIEREDYVSSLAIKLETGNGSPRVSVTSAKIDHEPFVNFLIDAHWQGGHLLREYTVLLDPPDLAASQPAAALAAPAPSASNSGPDAGAAAEVAPAAPAAPAAAVAAEPAPALTAPAPASTAAEASAGPAATSPSSPPSKATSPQAPAAPKPAAAKSAVPRQKTPSAVASKAPVPATSPAVASAVMSDKTYGPIDPAETLWSIAGKLRPEAASTDQTLLALGLANPGAFVHGSFNGLLKGSTLNVPSDDQILSVAPEVAKARIAKWRAGGSLNGEAGSDAQTATPAAGGENSKPAAVAEKKVEPAAATAAGTPLAPAANAPAKPVEPPAALPIPADKPAAIPPKTAVAPVASSPLPTGSTVPAADSATANSSTTAGAAAVPPDSTTASAVAAKPADVPAAAPTSANPGASPLSSSDASSSAKTDSPSAAASPPAAVSPAPVPAPAASAPAAASSAGLGDWSLPLIVLLLILLVVYLGWRVTRSKKSATKTTAASASKMPVASKSPPTDLGLDSLIAPGRAPPAARDSVASRESGRAGDFAKPVTETKPFVDEAPTMFAPVAAPPRASNEIQKTAPVPTDVPSDPLSEADFHLAYGLHDEAANLLKRGIEKEPMRKDLRVKLAETYFAAHKAPEFQETALALRGQISETEWQKLATMGRQIAPDIAAFRDSNDVRPLASAPVPRSTPAAAPSGDRGLDSDLDRTVVKSPSSPEAQPTPAIGNNNLIDFDFDTALSSLQPKSAREEILPENPPAGEAAHIDMGRSASAPAPTPSPTLDFQSHELDLSQAFPESAAVGSEDEISTKLDLARAYADMGDNQAASELLREVALAGSAAQKQEAEVLAKRLGAI